MKGKTPSFTKPVMNIVNEQIPPGADCSHGPCPSHPITATRRGGRRWHHCWKFTVTTGQTPAWGSNKQQGNGWEFLIAFRVLISEENILLTHTALCCKDITSNQPNLLHVKLKLGSPGDHFISGIFSFYLDLSIQRNTKVVNSKPAWEAPQAGNRAPEVTTSNPSKVFSTIVFDL